MQHCRRIVFPPIFCIYLVVCRQDFTRNLKVFLVVCKFFLGPFYAEIFLGYEFFCKKKTYLHPKTIVSKCCAPYSIIYLFHGAESFLRS